MEGRKLHKNEEASAFKLSSEESNQRCRIFVDARPLILYVLSHLVPVVGKVKALSTG